MLNKAGRKLQSLYLDGRLRINRTLGLPAQTGKDIQIFKRIFDSCTNKRIKIFEWGSGFSTIYYANYLRDKKIEFEWHSVDNNQVWHEKVKSKVQKKGLVPHVQLYLKEFQPFWKKPGWGDIPPSCGVFSPKSENEMSYIKFPKQFNDSFDIVIIDARFRRHCIQTAKEVLLPEGIVILHDAQKTHYHDGLGNFKYRIFLDTGAWYPFQKIPNKVWIGSMGNKEIFEVLKSL